MFAHLDQTAGENGAKMRKWRANYKEVQKRREKNIELTHSFVPVIIFEFSFGGEFDI